MSAKATHFGVPLRRIQRRGGMAMTAMKAASSIGATMDAGIRKVQLHGVHEEQVFLRFSATRLAQFGITAAEIIATLEAQNVVLPGGRIDAAEQNVIVSPSGNFRDLDDIENLELGIPGIQQTIRLRDVVTVERGFADPPRDLAYFNGDRAIVISVSITPGVNSVAFGEQLTSKLEVLESELPIGYVLEYATFQPDLVLEAIDGGLSNVYQTILIVLAVVMVFLGVRTGLIVGSFVPLTMLLGLIVMRMVGIELERVSIASAIIALGMLVDNGIVIAEDIRSRLEPGEDRRQACIETGKTLSIPLLTSSLTTILAFMPMLLIWQFNSFRRPLLIFITIPLAFTGGFIGLLITGAAFAFFAMLGLLSLAGVIINNGIVLIDKIDSDRTEGLAPHAAILNAALSRFRPILMTTVTTVLGLMPLILSHDPLFFSMAVILAFGLVFGTVLTLGVVPAIYAVLFRIKRTSG